MTLPCISLPDGRKLYANEIIFSWNDSLNLILSMPVDAQLPEKVNLILEDLDDGE